MARASADEVPFAEGVRIRVEDTRTRVGLALVRLKISELVIKDSRVTGEYEIRVPLRKSKNDDGLINLGFQHDVAATLAAGGTLKGEGISAIFKDDPPRTITCKISPDPATTESGAILLTIETSDRKIEFRSRYRIVK